MTISYTGAYRSVGCAQLMASNLQADIYEESSPLNGTAALQVAVTRSRVSTIKTTAVH